MLEMKFCRLIINGDDFGASEEVNEAVILAHRRGILTSASLMVSGRACEHAINLAKENPLLAVGLHVTLVDGRSVLHPSQIPHVADNNGTFQGDPALAGLRYFFCRSARHELFNEIAAQFEKFSQSGLRFAHVDSHCHMHVHPVVLDAIVKIAENYRIKRIRVPADDFFSAHPFLKSPLFAAGYALVFKLLTATMKRKLRRRGFIFPRRVYGNLLTGNMSLEYVLSLLDRLPPGASEIYFHPALPAKPSTQDAGQLQRFRELCILLHPKALSKIQRLGIIPSTYFDLEKDA
jgi:hopanoid biosynthesis associated protein HpnK